MQPAGRRRATAWADTLHIEAQRLPDGSWMVAAGRNGGALASHHELVQPDSRIGRALEALARSTQPQRR